MKFEPMDPQKYYNLPAQHECYANHSECAQSKSFLKALYFLGNRTNQG
jgi:hypothetical protein